MTQTTTPAPFGILFDLDGVLVDSEGEYSIFWGETGRRYGLRPTFADDIKGTTIDEILLNLPESDRQSILESLHRFESEMRYPVFPGVIPFLEELRRAGIPTAIVTSSDNVKMDLLRRRQPQLLPLIDPLVTGDMVTHSKPDPEGYLRGASLIGLPATRCYVFEDSLQGLQAGRASGATVIGLATTNSADKVSPLADLTLPRFEGISIATLPPLKA